MLSLSKSQDLSIKKTSLHNNTKLVLLKMYICPGYRCTKALTQNLNLRKHK